MSNYAGYSGSHLSMIFKRTTDHSPLNYFNMLKMQPAWQLLTETSMKTNQICYKVGIDDNLYFSRLFTKIM